MQERLDYGVSAPSPPRPRVGILLLFFVVAAAIFVAIHRTDLAGWWMEDLPVYAHAVRTWMAGRSPYDSSLAPLFFLYPPAFLYLAGALSYLVPGSSGEYVYMGVLVLAACAMPLVLARYFFRMVWLSPLFALLLFFASPRFTGVLALCGMNIASILYCLAFIGAVPGLRKNKWMWFYAAVFLAAIIKITFLALLLLPLLAGRRQWLRSIACGVAVVAMNLGEQALLPKLYSEYRWSLVQGIMVQQQYGYGVFGIVATYHHKQRNGAGFAPYLISGLLAVGIVTLMLLLRRRLERTAGLVNPAENGVWLALVVTTIILVNPREMQYDVDIALLAGFVLWVYALKTERLLALMTLLFLPSLVVPLVVLNPHLHGMYETLLVLGAYGLALWRMWRETRTEEMEADSLAGVHTAGMVV